MHLIPGACCEKLPLGIFYPTSWGPRISHLNSNPLKVLLPSVCVNEWVSVWVWVCACMCVCGCELYEHCAMSACLKLQKSLGLIPQAFTRLNANSPVWLACLISGTHKEKCKWMQDLSLSHNAATPMFNPVLQRKTSPLNLLTLHGSSQTAKHSSFPQNSERNRNCTHFKWDLRC